MNPNTQPSQPDQKNPAKANGDPNRPGTFYGDSNKPGKDQPDYEPGKYGSPRPDEQQEKNAPGKKGA